MEAAAQEPDGSGGAEPGQVEGDWDDEDTALAPCFTLALPPALVEASQTALTVQWETVHLEDAQAAGTDAGAQHCLLTFYLEVQEVRSPPNHLLYSDARLKQS